MTEPGFSRGDVVICALPGDYGKPRPAVVVQSDLFNQTHASVVLCPISSEVTGLSLFRVSVARSAVSGLAADSEIMADKISAVKQARIRRRLGALSHDHMQALDRALRLWLDLQATPGEAA
ncbi:MAG: type II toxin-antitoxin system PemK/MazF family toxin [Bryobacteraceae bacterium]